MSTSPITGPFTGPLTGRDLPVARELHAEPRASERELREAAEGLEAYFVRQLIGELTKSSGGLGGLGGSGFAGESFGQLLQDALAQNIAEAGGLGLAAQLAPAMSGGDPALERLSALGPRTIAAHGYIRPGTLAVGGARARAAYLANTPGTLTTSPVAGRVSSGYGARVDPIGGHEAHHHGLDIAAPEGAPVRAAGAGTVVRAGEEGGYGNVVVVDHGDGVETRYAHLSAIHVKAGERLTAGAELGLVGSTGKSTGPHLHFEVRRNGESIDPSKAVRGLR